MTNVLFRKEYPKEYTSSVSTRVSNALLVGEILGQVVVGLTCDLMGRKFAIILTTLLIVVGGILATASHGITIDGMFWMLTVSRGIVGFGAGKLLHSPAKNLLNHLLTIVKAANTLRLVPQLQRLPTNTPWQTEAQSSFLSRISLSPLVDQLLCLSS